MLEDKWISIIPCYRLWSKRISF